MEDKVIKLQISGTPQTLLENALEEAPDMKFVVMVYVNKDGTFNTEWSKIETNLEGLGAVEMLKNALIDAMKE